MHGVLFVGIVMEIRSGDRILVTLGSRGRSYSQKSGKLPFGLVVKASSASPRGGGFESQPDQKLLIDILTVCINFWPNDPP